MTDRNYDPDLRDLIPLLPTVSDFSTPAKVREAREQGFAVQIASEPNPDVVKTDMSVPSAPDQPEVEVRVYRPSTPSEEPRPAVFEIHGGGFLVGSKDMMDPWCERVCSELDAVVVSTDYRLAPEHPFPAGVEDCYHALCWTVAQADALGIDTERVAIAGQSAGGGLAAACALMARDRNGPRLCFQLLEIPELDDRLETDSMQQFSDTPLWNRPNAEWSWRHYLGPEHKGPVSSYAAPARETDLRDLPPAYVSTMEFDPLRDEGILYALSLMRDGVRTELHAYPGTFHGSSLAPSAESSVRIARDALESLRGALRPQ